MTKNTHQNHSAGTGGPNGEFRFSDAKKNSTGHWLSQEMHLIDIFGNPFFLSYVDLRMIVLDKWMAGILFLTILALYAGDPHGYRGHMHEFWALTIWLGSTFALFGIRAFTYAVVAIAQAKNLLKRLYVPAMSAAEYGVLFLGVTWVSYALAEDDYPFNFLISFPFTLFGFLMLEAFFIRFVIPAALLRKQPREQADAPQLAPTAPQPDESAQVAAPTHKTPEVVCLALPDRKIRLDTLLWMQSEEHYVHIQTRHESLTVRAKLPALLEQIPQEFGVRCHRSWWVSRVAKPVIKKCEQGLCLVGTNGCDAPIARSRKKNVREWLDLNRDW